MRAHRIAGMVANRLGVIKQNKNYRWIVDSDYGDIAVRSYKAMNLRTFVTFTNGRIAEIDFTRPANLEQKTGFFFLVRKLAQVYFWRYRNVENE